MFFFTETATTWIYTYVHTLSLPDALPICLRSSGLAGDAHSPHLFSVRAERVEALSVFNRRKKERPFDTLRANGGEARKRLHPCRDDDRPVDLCRDRRHGRRAAPQQRRYAGRGAGAASGETGRAAGGERGCQYV